MRTQKYVYHASSTRGLKYLEPRESTHQQNWVYATKKIAISAMFLGNNFDFICQTGTEKGIPHISERFEGALKHAYQEKGGVIYRLPAETFLEGKTQWSAEVVSETRVEILEEIEVKDALIFLENLAKKGELIIYKYPNKPKGFPNDKSDIIERAVDWTMKFGENTLDITEKYHPDVLENTIKELKAKNYAPTSKKWKEKFK